MATKNGGNDTGSCFNKVCISLVIVLVLCLYILYMFLDFSPILQTQSLFERMFFNNAEPEWPRKMSVAMPLVLSWNRYFGESTVMKWLQTQFDVRECSFRCRYSGDRELASNASIIIFHIRNQLQPLPAHRDPSQLYTFFLLESPLNTGNGYRMEVPPDFFNITMTYRMDSDVPAPYDLFDALESNGGAETGDAQNRWTDDEIQQKVAGKHELALQFVSNCHTSSGREKFVEQLKQYMNITQVGSCVHKGGCHDECSNRLIDSHFFYLAFENSVCHNYVTEKFWNIKRLIVPVVLSRQVFAGMNVPNDAYIAADDFSGAEELANHLKMLAANKQYYLNYLQWTRRFKKNPHRKERLNPLCELCGLAYEKPQRQIADIVNLWEGGGKCQDGFSDRKLLHRQ